MYVLKAIKKPGEYLKMRVFFPDGTCTDGLLHRPNTAPTVFMLTNDIRLRGDGCENMHGYEFSWRIPSEDYYWDCVKYGTFSRVELYEYKKVIKQL